MKSLNECERLIKAGRIRRAVDFSYEDSQTGKDWNDEVYVLVDRDRLALGHNGSLAVIPRTTPIRRHRTKRTTTTTSAAA